MLAYRIPDVSPAACVDAVRDGVHPGLTRIALAGPWQFSAHPGGGALATWRGTAVPSPDDLAKRDAVESADGLTWYRPNPLPSLSEVSKATHGEYDVEVPLYNGVLVVAIPIAASAPYRMRFASASTFAPATEYGRLAREVDRLFLESNRDAEDRRKAGDADARGTVTTEHPLVKRLVVLALQQRYRVTDELLDDTGWISSEDIDPILVAIMGGEKKA